MRVAFNFNGPNKLGKISFNNIVAMEISPVFECDSTNSSSADTNLDTVRFYRKCQLKQLASYLAVQGRFKRNREEIYLLAMEKMRQRKRKFERKLKRCNLCRQEMEVTEELKIVRLLQIKFIITQLFVKMPRLFRQCFSSTYMSFLNFVLVSSGCFRI